jgi:uncharacterized protein YcaQ
MPVLHRGHLIARVDPAREGGTLVARRVTMERSDPEAVAGVGAALREAATWVGAEAVAVADVRPAQAAAAVRRAV